MIGRTFDESTVVLGIETSCDETAAAIVMGGTDVLSSVVSSQIDIHAKFGGVVPEVASRAHLELIQPVIDEAISSAGIHHDRIDAIAVTIGPGLIGALLVGVSAAKAMALGLDRPLIGVNHLEAHLYAALLDERITDVSLVDPPVSHREGPIFLNVLRVLDIPEALGLLAPRPLVIRGAQTFAATRELYTAAGAGGSLKWMP